MTEPTSTLEPRRIETIAPTPPLIVSESQIAEIFEKVGRAIRAVA